MENSYYYLLCLLLFNTLMGCQDECILNDIPQEIYTKITTDEGILENSTVNINNLLTCNNNLVDILIDGPEIFSEIKRIIKTAKHEINIVFMEWEGDSEAVRKICEGLQEVNSPNVYVKIIIKDNILPFTGRTIDNVYESIREFNLDDNPNLIIKLATAQAWKIRDVLHEKYVIVDGNQLVITGANPQNVHDSITNRWHDTGYSLKGGVASSALSTFDNLWRINNTKHWDCRERNFRYDCKETNFGINNRSWLNKEEEDKIPYYLPIIALGRKAEGETNDNTKNINNPQDQGWITSILKAKKNINIITPNINDDTFRFLIKKAVIADVKVHLMTSYDFNSCTENIRKQGGSNIEVVSKLNKYFINNYPSKYKNFVVSWYSKDGESIIRGKKNISANHTKFLKIDDEFVIIGSGNMDTQSWNYSREFNLLLDSKSSVNRINNAFYHTDSAKSISNVVELYEGIDATEDILYVSELNHSYYINSLQKTNRGCSLFSINDAIQSCIIYNSVPGTRLLFFDEEGRKRLDDWVEIEIKAHFEFYKIKTFENSFEDDLIKLTWHRGEDNRIRGKISSMEVLHHEDVSPPLIVMREDIDFQGDFTGEIRNASPNRTINFKDTNRVKNDHASSMAMHNFIKDTVIKIYDDPDGSISDDWTEILIKQDIDYKIIPSLDQIFEDDDVKLIFHRHGGRVNGKASRIEISSIIDANTGN